MRFPISTLTVGVLLLLQSSLSAAAAGDNLSDPQQVCLFTCAIAASDAVGCLNVTGANAIQCTCGSSIWVTNFTTCGTTTCELSKSDVKAVIKEGCGDIAIAEDKSTASQLKVATAGVIGLLPLSLAAFV
ncbi:hypothetical protein R3P38DRAFT_2960013 [Favolaschia claudopus]|uniref:Extracellular membrane protein CFEM domain-containing protein n=1 Tax=Favolaschia claudopus TaxID=2862362 RepID=A0AAW0B933_9AGAR